MNNELTVSMLVIGRLNELKSLHEAFGGVVFFEMGQSLLNSAESCGIDDIPFDLFEYFKAEV